MLLLVVLGIVLPSGVAYAHSFLVSATPQPGSRLGSSPPDIELRFTEPVAGGERIRVKNRSGGLIATGPVRIHGLVVEASLPRLSDGVFVVSWQVTSSDGDQTVGEFAFAVGKAGAIPASKTGSGSSLPKAAARWVLLSGLFLAFGALVSERWIWAPVARRYGSEFARAPVGWLLAVALGGAVLQFLLLAGRVISGSPGSPGGAATLASRPVALAGGEVLLIGYALLLVVVPIAQARLGAGLPLGVAVAIAALQGHPGTLSPWWGGLANVIHLGAVGLWLGTLAHLVFVLRRARTSDRPSAGLGEGSRRYAGLAIGLVVAAVGSGLVVAGSLFATPGELVSTTYGRLLLVKSLLVGVVLAVAILARTRALHGNPHPRVSLLRRLTSAEALALLLVLAVATVLAASPPPSVPVAAAAADVLGPPPLQPPVLVLAGFTGSLAVYLSAGEDALEIVVLAPSGNPAPLKSLRVSGRSPDAKAIVVSPRPCGTGCVTVALPWESGTTALSVQVASRDWGAGTLSFAVSWPPAPEDPALLTRVIAAMQSQPQFTVTESVSSGVGPGSKVTSPISGAQFLASEPFAAGGVSDVRELPLAAGAAVGTRLLALYLPGSSIWYLLEIDANDRIQRETIVDPGHLIQRTFAY